MGCMFSQGLLDEIGYNKLIEELKVLYKQYWPEDTSVMYVETEAEVSGLLKEPSVAVNNTLISTAECKCGFSQMNLIY